MGLISPRSPIRSRGLALAWVLTLTLTVSLGPGSGLALGFQDAPPGKQDLLEALGKQEPGMDRARDIREALDLGPSAAPEGQWSALLNLAYGAFMEELGAYRSQAASWIADAMYRADPAIWSAFCAEGVARRRGDLQRADQVLVEQLARSGELESRLAITERRAIVAAGAGWAQGELDRLGRALALGGADGLQMRARLALAKGQRLRARTLFRILVDRSRGPHPTLPEPPAWALRGWGLALLPTAPDPSRR